MNEDLFTIEDTCPVCEKKFMTDGYLWTCSECQHSPADCDCGSDDVTLDWSVCDLNGNILEAHIWIVQCHMCDKTTLLYNEAKEALDAWNGGKRFRPIPGTDHFEEAW